MASFQRAFNICFTRNIFIQRHIRYNLYTKKCLFGGCDPGFLLIRDIPSKKGKDVNLTIMDESSGYDVSPNWDLFQKPGHNYRKKRL